MELDKAKKIVAEYLTNKREMDNIVKKAIHVLLEALSTDEQLKKFGLTYE